MKGTLIVEGNADVFFFDALLREWKINGVTVSPPASVKRVNGKFHAIEALGIFTKQLLDESIDRLGIVLDADSPLEQENRGFQTTLSAVDKRLNTYGFSRSSVVGGGFIYSMRSGKMNRKIYLWVMPDSNSDGTLENFVRNQLLKDSAQDEWYEQARNAVNSLESPMFNRAAHELKAVTSTWLAWQKYPGKGIQSVVGDGLIDLSGGTAQNLKNWLEVAFK